MNNMESSLALRAVRISVSVSFYMVVSISLVFLNKLIMKNSEFEFPYPLLITWIQLFVSQCIILSIMMLGKYVHRIFSFIPAEFDLDKVKKVAPLTVIYVGMLGFNNLCLKFVSVFFYQVARSLTIVFNILLTFVILRQKTSLLTGAACSVVVLGFMIGSKGEVNFSLIGTIFGVSSSVFVALYSIFVKKTLPVVDKDEWLLIHYNTSIALVFLFPIIVLDGELLAGLRVDFLFDPRFIGVNVLTGFVGFLINVAVFVLIKYTSPLTNNITGTVKACLQSILSIIIFGDDVSLLAALGIILVIGGSTWYSLIRFMSMKKTEDEALSLPTEAVRESEITVEEMTPDEDESWESDP